MTGLPRALAILLLLAAAAAGWLAHGRGLLLRAPDMEGRAQAAVMALKARSTLMVYSAYVTVAATGRTAPAELLQQKVTILQPAWVHFGVDLSRLDARSFRYDAARRRLMVQVPDVAIVSRDLLTAEKQTFKDTFVTSKFTGTEEQLQQKAEKAVRAALDEKVMSAPIMGYARESARVQVRALLEAAFRATGQPVEIDVQVGPVPAS